MNNKGRKFIRKYLIQASNAEDVISNHAFGRVARKHKPIPKRRPSSAGHGTVASYRDSMVGSISQYHDRTVVHTEKPAPHKEVKADHDIIGNRPRSGTKSNQTAEERRHHFVEPPKRNFNRFD